MEIHFTIERSSGTYVLQNGRGTPVKILQDVVAGYFEELAQASQMLNSRYDDLTSGRVQPVPGEEVGAYFREKNAAARGLQPGS